MQTYEKTLRIILDLAVDLTVNPGHSSQVESTCTHIQRHMPVLVLHEQLDQLFKQRDRLDRLLLRPHVSATSAALPGEDDRR